MCHTIDPVFADILTWIGESGVPLIYELDDNLLDAPAIPGLDYGIREAVRRVRGHVVEFRDVMAWEVRRWRAVFGAPKR